jgi:uncharacterized protein DUF6869
MGWCEERLGFPQGADGAAEPPTADEVDARLAALPVEDLVRGFREASTTGLKEQTPAVHAFHMYFDGLAYHWPERALAFIEAELANEQDDAIVALLAEGKLLGQLLHFHAGRVAKPLQEMALRQPRLRWLLGGAAWGIGGGMVEQADAKRRLLSIADEPAYRAWKKKHKASRESIDVASLCVEELAPLWVELTSRSDLDKERDDNYSALFDFQYELVNEDPFKALELVKAIVAIEDNPGVIGLLAAGMLEDLIPAENGPVVDAVVAEAERNPRFRHLLGGVWFSGMSPTVTERLEKARGEQRW